MAIHYADVTTTATEYAHERGSGLSGGGQIRMLRAFYTTTTGTDEATNDTIVLGSLPVGSVVIPQLSWYAHEVLAATAWTMNIGDSTDTDRYCIGQDLKATTGLRSFLRLDWDSADPSGGGDIITAFPDAVFNPHTVTEATRQVIATLTSITGPVASRDISFCIAYHAQV